MLGGIGGRRRRGQQTMRWLDGITDLMGMGLGRLRELVMDREGWHAVIHGVAKSGTRLRDWTELNWITLQYCNGFCHTLTWIGQYNRIFFFSWSFWARYCAVHFLAIMLLTHQISSMEVVTTIMLPFKWRVWCTDTFSNLPKATLLLNDRVWI